MKRVTFTSNGTTYKATAFNGILHPRTISVATSAKKRQTLERLVGVEPKPPAFDPTETVRSDEREKAYAEWKEAHAIWQKRYGEVYWEKRPVYLCDKCGKQVAWAKNETTGKFFLCDVAYHTARGKWKRFHDFYFHEDRPHFKTCSS